MHDAKLVHEELCSIARTRLELHAREARLLVLAEELELWRDHGCATLFEYLERFCDLHPRTAREYLRVARALKVLPIMRDQLDGRHVSYSTVRELTRVATPENEAQWLRAVAGLSAREIEEEVSGHGHGDGPDDPKDPDRLVKLVLDVRESTYAAFVEARSRYTDEQGDRLSDDEVVLAMCREAPDIAACIEPETEDEDTNSVTASPIPFQLSISTCGTCAKSFLRTAGREVVVPPSMLDTARCDARFIGDLEAELPPRALASVSPRMREQVLARDRNACTVPGCRSKRFLHIHHIEFQSLGGRHVMSNLTALCSSHHTHLHEAVLEVRGQAPHALTWTWPQDPTRTSTATASDSRQHPSTRTGRPAWATCRRCASPSHRPRTRRPTWAAARNLPMSTSADEPRRGSRRREKARCRAGRARRERWSTCSGPRGRLPAMHAVRRRCISTAHIRHLSCRYTHRSWGTSMERASMKRHTNAAARLDARTGDSSPSHEIAPERRRGRRPKAAAARAA